MRSLLTRPPTPESSVAGSCRNENAVLVTEAKAEASELAPLYARYVDPVYRYCFRLPVGNEKQD
jgi:hypothetical protein